MRGLPSTVLTVACGSLLPLLLVPAAGAAGAGPEELWREIESSRLEIGRAVAVRNLKLRSGLAELSIDGGVLTPASPIAGRSVEMVFQGRARLAVEPPDDVEAGQLELFTDGSRLDEEVTEAVLVVALDSASETFLARPPATPDAARARRAEQIFRRWRERPERRLLGVDHAIFRDAVGDPLYRSFFAGWFRGRKLGEFLYLFEPDAAEQVTLGQFRLLDATEKEKRKLTRRLHREQRRGRLIGLVVEDLGQWDTWLSASPAAEDGEPRPGGPGFEPRHYELEVSLEGDELAIEGRARLHLEPRLERPRVVKLEIHPDLAIRRATLLSESGAGEELFFRQTRDEVLAVLPEDLELAGLDAIVLELEYSGFLLEKGTSRSWVLTDTTRWHPHAGQTDLATYDVTFHWPGDLDLVTGGRRIAAGTEREGRRFERRRLEHPTFAVSFEVGRFQTLRARAGQVAVSLAFDPLARTYLDPRSREALLATVTDVLHFFEQVFGPYPLDELVLVTVPRNFSQSLLGFVTLSSLNMVDAGLETLLLGIEDRRTVVAHEIAHQWWGHVVPWQGYRAQWISEAMANYSALLYARRRLRGGTPVIGPTTAWQDVLTSVTEDGRPLESIGPLVLGERLASSRSSNAYEAIVYKKGAVVLDMLARSFGEESFLAILRQLVQTVAFRPMSTELLLGALERLSGRELGGFADQFIYGTGLPEVTYDYRFEPSEGGKWRVVATVRQRSPFRYRYRVVTREDGSLDVGRERHEQIEVADSTLFVPVQLAVYDPAADDGRRHRGQLDPREVGNALLQTHLLLEGETSELRLDLDHEPREMWLDRNQEVFGRFFNHRRHPKRRLLSQALDAAAEGRPREAEERLTEALAAAVSEGPSYAPEDLDGEVEGRLLDASIYLHLGRLYLDGGRTADARRALKQAEERVTRAARFLFDDALEILEARLALREGNFDGAFRRLRGVRRGQNDSIEGLVLLAIAARATGHQREFQAALEEARARGADLSLLRD